MASAHASWLRPRSTSRAIAAPSAIRRMPPFILSSRAPRKHEKPAMKSGFSVQVAKENLKFSAAHCMAYPGFREALHGHNCQVGVSIEGRLGVAGYVLD